MSRLPVVVPIRIRIPIRSETCRYFFSQHFTEAHRLPICNLVLDVIKDRPMPMPEDHTPELTDRLNRIELLIQNLIEQSAHPRGPPQVIYQPQPQPPPPPTLSRTASISESSIDFCAVCGIVTYNSVDNTDVYMPWLPGSLLAWPPVCAQSTRCADASALSESGLRRSDA